MNLSKLILPLSLAVATTSFAQNTNKANFIPDKDEVKINQIDSLPNVIYANALNYKGEAQDLAMDIYFPAKSEDKAQKRPFVLIIHGGGFVYGSKEWMTYLSQEFAKHGFVTANMSYRLGMESEADAASALYRAQQDANAAMRYVVKNADEFHVDLDWLFIGGTSAGAFTSLITAYGQQAEWNAGFPQLETELGALTSSGNDIQTDFSIKGIFNHMGAVSPMVVQPEEMLPTISFHGDNDQRVNIDTSFMGIGSRAIHDKLTTEGVCNDLTIVPGGRHDIYWSAEGNSFMVERASCFFKSIIIDNCTDYKATEDVPAKCSD